MHYRKLDLNLLAALNVLLREKSVTRAAEHLNLSPSSTSQALSRLRDYFQDELLYQVGRSMNLTARAEELREALPQLFLNIDALISTSARFDPAMSQRTFRICASDYVLTVLAPHLFSLARQRDFKGRIDFVPLRETPSRELKLGNVDLIVIPQTVIDQEHPNELLYEERFVCIVWSGSRLAQGAMTLERYEAAHHLLMQLSVGGGEVFDVPFVTLSGARRQVAASTYSFSALPALIVGTDTVATVQLRLARYAQRSWPVTIKESPIAMDPMQQVIQWHGSRTHDVGLQWLRSLFVQAVSLMDSREE